MENMTYEQAMTRLDEIIKKLESNSVSLDESITLYEEGVKLAGYCDQKIRSIEDKVTKIYENKKLHDYNGEE